MLVQHIFPQTSCMGYLQMFIVHYLNEAVSSSGFFFSPHFCDVAEVPNQDSLARFGYRKDMKIKRVY